MRKLLVLLLPACLLCACETDSYDKGEGKYSLMQADFAELTVNSEKQGTQFLTDEGEQYRLVTPVTASWIQRPDTMYRAIVYFNKTAAGEAQATAMGQMGVLRPIEHGRFKEQPQDPLGVESLWLTKNGKYINMGLLLKNGHVEDKEGTHAMALCQDTVLVNPDRTRTAYYRLLHSQGDAPEYYTNRRYVSIQLPQDRPDSVRLSIHTYEGTLEKLFAL
jgi:hypothetical protein